MPRRIKQFPALHQRPAPPPQNQQLPAIRAEVAPDFTF
jgi:hypothetical protein